MSVVALPTIKIKGKEYFIDERLQEIRSKVYPPKRIRFINFGNLSKKNLAKVLNKLYKHRISFNAERRG